MASDPENKVVSLQEFNARGGKKVIRLSEGLVERNKAAEKFVRQLVTCIENNQWTTCGVMIDNNPEKVIKSLEILAASKDTAQNDLALRAMITEGAGLTCEMGKIRYGRGMIDVLKALPRPSQVMLLSTPRVVGFMIGAYIGHGMTQRYAEEVIGLIRDYSPADMKSVMREITTVESLIWQSPDKVIPLIKELSPQDRENLFRVGRRESAKISGSTLDKALVVRTKDPDHRQWVRSVLPDTVFERYSVIHPPPQTPAAKKRRAGYLRLV